MRYRIPMGVVLVSDAGPAVASSWEGGQAIAALTGVLLVHYTARGTDPTAAPIGAALFAGITAHAIHQVLRTGDE